MSGSEEAQEIVARTILSPSTVNPSKYSIEGKSSGRVDNSDLMNITFPSEKLRTCVSKKVLERVEDQMSEESELDNAFTDNEMVDSEEEGDDDDDGDVDEGVDTDVDVEDDDQALTQPLNQAFTDDSNDEEDSESDNDRGGNVFLLPVQNGEGGTNLSQQRSDEKNHHHAGESDGSESEDGEEESEEEDDTYSKGFNPDHSNFAEVSTGGMKSDKCTNKLSSSRPGKTIDSSLKMMNVDEEGKVFCKENPGNFSYLFCNCRGFSSKRESLKNILSSSDFDVVCFCETHLYFNKKPEVNGYTFVSRSREKVNSKGGVAIGVKSELAQYVVKLYEGRGSNESIIIKLTCYEPHLVVAVMYGNQENTTGADVIRSNLVEFFAQIGRYQEQGLDVVVGGDFNVHVGKAVIGNDPSISKGGETLIDICEELGLDILNNNVSGKTHTHYDVSSGTSRVLDLVLSNKAEDTVKIEVDNEKIVTPFRMKQDGPGSFKKSYTDHLSVYGEIKVKRPSKYKKKLKMWRLNAPGSKLRYETLTDEKADDAADIIMNSKDSDEMLEKLNKLIEEIKLEAYGLTTITHKKFERIVDERLNLKRFMELEKAKNDLDNKAAKVNDKIFTTRKNLMKEQEAFTEAMDHYKTGERLENPEDIRRSVLQYNAEVLEKNECRNERARQLREMKAETVEALGKVKDDDSEESITWEEFRVVCNKVHAMNKTCYRDFVRAGPKWQATIYLMFRRIYDTEDIPKEFMRTKLKQLYKKKGDKSKLSSYRFIHLKSWAGKMMEKLVMAKCQDLIMDAMPKGQLGGVKKSKCAEHIASILALARIKQKQNKGIILQFFDVKKCFDKQLLDDTMYSAAVAGLRGKRLRVMKNLHDNTRICLVGDPDENEVVIRNSTGQGTNWAPAACSLSMGQTIVEEAERRPKSRMKIDENLELDPLMYVDDTLFIHDSVEGARAGGNVITDAFDELGLEAHSDKSRQVVMGPKRFKDKIDDQLRSEPVMVQDWELKDSECETYLGCEISSKGVRDSISRSIKKRCRAATAKAVQLNKMLDEDMFDKIGWIDAVKTLFNSIIVPTVTYATEAFAFMQKTQVSEIEACIKDLLYMMLKISKFTKYAAVLQECNMIRVKHIINKLKICFLNDLIHDKSDGFCLDILRKEEELFPGTGLIAEVSQLCEEYGIQDVTMMRENKEVIKEAIWNYGRIEVWQEALKDPRVPFNHTHDKQYKLYGSLPKYEAKLYFAYKVGSLRFKDYARSESIRKYGNSDCWIPGCTGPDTLEHVLSCWGYKTKYKGPEWKWEDLKTIKRVANYLTELDRERTRRFGMSLLYRPGLKEAMAQAG